MIFKIFNSQIITQLIFMTPFVIEVKNSFGRNDWSFLSIFWSKNSFWKRWIFIFSKVSISPNRFSFFWDSMQRSLRVLFTWIEIWLSLSLLIRTINGNFIFFGYLVVVKLWEVSKSWAVWFCSKSWFLLIRFLMAIDL